MVLIQLHGRITESGQLELDLPKDLPPGDVQVTIESTVREDVPWEDRPWTDEELAELMTITPKTGAEIAKWLESVESTGWEHIKMSGAEWVEEQRRKHSWKFTKW